MNLDGIKPSKILRILIWLVIIPSLIGDIFKVLHYPGSSLLMMFGTFIFAFFYLPLFAIESWKSKETRPSKISLIIQIIVLFIFAIGFLFKIQHWEGAGLFVIITNYLLSFLVMPFALYHLIKSGKINLIKTHNILLIIFFFSHTISALMNSGSGKIKIETALQQGINTEEAFRAASSRNKQLYTTLNTIKIKENTALLSKVNQLKKITDYSITHIKDLKSYLLVTIDKIPKSEADTLSSLYIVNSVNTDLTTTILIGNEYHTNTDKYSAYKLKSVINCFRDSLLNLVQEQNRVIIKEGLNLSTDNYVGYEGEPISWEMTNFNFMPLLHVFNTLTNIQYEIKNAEYQVLTDIINSDNTDLNTALFSQIADLNSKFDAVKKQEEITQLQSENKKGMELLNAKDFELSESKQTIIYFVLVILVFLILVFFVIRSNYLRKQTNKTLFQQKEIIEFQKTEVESQKNLVEEKQKEIIDSIEYALRIQTAILPPQRIVKQYLENSFILYKPKDIVAGDFYWMETVDDIVLFAACDCTGHGVPGAMVSVVCHNALNRAVREFGLTQPAAILDKTAEIVVENFSKSDEDIQDGMDISLCAYHPKTKKLEWAGANNPLWLLQNGELIETKADKQPIGMNENSKPFINHTFNLSVGDSIYLFTDGFADQFGGETGQKKLTRKRFKDLIMSLQSKSLQEQGIALDKFIIEYKKEIEQIDDILVIGVKI